MAEPSAPDVAVDRLRWLLGAGLAAAWLLFVLLRLPLAPSHAGPAEALLVATLLLLIGALVDRAMLVPLGRMRSALRLHSAELVALRDAALDISADLNLDSVLQRIVDRSRELLGTRYGALSVVEDDGRVLSFISSGIDPELRRRIGAPPRGEGLLGVPLRQGERLRLDDLGADPRHAGFPPGHPPMRTLLAVPLPSHRGRRGNLYLSEKEDGSAFTASEEETLVRFAIQAAIAVDNAILHRETHELAGARERLRLAGETYDGMAQVLAYVNTKSQVVREHVRQGRIEAALSHLDQLAAAARRIYAEQRARLLDLRALGNNESSTVEAISHHVRAWEDEAGLDVDLQLPSAVEAPPEVELQLLRIVQEGLDNVRRHAQASRVRLALRQDTHGIRLELADDGVGFDPALPLARGEGPRFGLAAMRERAQAVGGSFEVTAAPGTGTVLHFEVPTAICEEGDHATTHR